MPPARERFKPQKDEEDEDSLEETTEEKVKAGAVAWLGWLSECQSFARLCRDSIVLRFGLRAAGTKTAKSAQFQKGKRRTLAGGCDKVQRIPLAFLAAVILGIWTPGTDLEIGVRA